MVARVAAGLAAAALLASAVAVALAVTALVKDSPAPAAPTKDEPGAYTKAMVEDAIRRYEDIGLEASINFYNSRDNVDGEWYVFIINDQGYTIAHHNPMFRNRDPSLRVDTAGKFYGDELLGSTEQGRWVDYVLLNPDTGEESQKHTWAVRHDGLLFASGWYER